MDQANPILETLAEQVAPGHTALLIVDVQNDFIHPDGFMARRRLAGFADTTSMVAPAIERLETLLAGARRAEVLCVFIQMLGDTKYQSPAAIAQQRRIQAGAPGGCVLEGTWGADFSDPIRPDGRSREVTVQKYRYSGFWGTNLNLVLRSHGIRTVVMTGAATSGCVESTARDAFFNDYHVVTAADCCADYDRDRHEHALRKLDLSFGYVVPSAEILAVWERALAEVVGGRARPRRPLPRRSRLRRRSPRPRRRGARARR
jgi:nicotinamidase-related amidase